MLLDRCMVFSVGEIVGFRGAKGDLLHGRECKILNRDAVLRRLVAPEPQVVLAFLERHRDRLGVLPRPDREGHTHDDFGFGVIHCEVESLIVIRRDDSCGQ